VVPEGHDDMSDAATDVREIASADRDWVRSFLEQQFRSTQPTTTSLPSGSIHAGGCVSSPFIAAIAESRKLKPEISRFGVGGRPIDDEVEFELVV
jgi:hypothetical protein